MYLSLPFPREQSSVYTDQYLRRVLWNSPGTNARTGSTNASTVSASRPRSACLNDSFHVSRQDREVDGEARWQTIGMVQGVRILVVAHTVEEDEKMIRILSARKATPRERRIYAQGY
jgi:uncharacterized DUF497 family protein